VQNTEANVTFGHHKHNSIQTNLLKTKELMLWQSQTEQSKM